MDVLYRKGTWGGSWLAARAYHPDAFERSTHFSIVEYIDSIFMKFRMSFSQTLANGCDAPKALVYRVRLVYFILGLERDKVISSVSRMPLKYPYFRQ